MRQIWYNFRSLCILVVDSALALPTLAIILPSRGKCGADRAGAVEMADDFGWVDRCDPTAVEFDEAPARIDSRAECLIEVLAAYRDIAEFDDIHQAAERLAAVQDWIRRDARAAAADPLFADEPAFRAERATA